MAKKKVESNNEYPLIKVYGNFFMWSKERIAEALKKATEDKAPEDAVFCVGKKWITRSDNFWSPTLLQQMNEVMPL